MLTITDNAISLTRGDTAEIDITLNDYVLESGDILTFTIKSSTSVSRVILQKTTETGVIRLDPLDTSKLYYGDYVYDVELKTAAGDIYTVIAPTSFKLTEEVTWHRDQ